MFAHCNQGGTVVFNETGKKQSNILIKTNKYHANLARRHTLKQETKYLRISEISSEEGIGERQRLLINTKYYISKTKQKIFNLYIVWYA